MLCSIYHCVATSSYCFIKICWSLCHTVPGWIRSRECEPFDEDIEGRRITWDYCDDLRIHLNDHTARTEDRKTRHNITSRCQPATISTPSHRSNRAQKSDGHPKTAATMASSSFHDYSTSPHLSIPISNLPLRIPGAQRILPRKHAEARLKLHQYRFAEQLPGDAAPTSIDSSAPFSSSQGSARSHCTFSASSASRTYPKAQSESSFATSRTNRTKNTYVFSAHDGSGLPEQEKKTLSPALRARKALLRFLGTCKECRKRKVKVCLGRRSPAHLPFS